MQFHRSTIAALAATVVLTLFTADGSGANAEPSEIPQTVATASVLTDETVPEIAAVEFVSEEVVQPVAEADEAIEAHGARSLRELVAEIDTPSTLSREMECLAGAIYFESRGEPLEGQLAVGQVVVNRADSQAFPSDYCGVVFQKAQFSFVRGGTMPRINRSSTAWKRAKAIARIAHEGLWDSKAGDALYFHANYVRPSWSRTKIARATIDTHIFYR
ncbi:cell wall hydrolase [Tsuneonella sp. YG55]|uniref:Cell wall hydrolase n=1 Tax=Tsuneonella litorea TaxID=2976475 RepID=A0A9X3AKI3_9SPHN|nr:cell wall hydrolase [Tsuneonella litorea]MCT2557883.1 cell wall hydrolase [Tsuneonella litorea]